MGNSHISLKETHLEIPKVGQAVIVTWLDSTNESGWAYITPDRVDKLAEVRRIKTLGWIIGASPVALAIASTTSAPSAPGDLEGHLCPLAIPLGCIVSIREVDAFDK